MTPIDGAILAQGNGAEVSKVSENTAKYPVKGVDEDEDGDSDATLGDRLREMWVNAGGRDGGVQGLRDTENGVRRMERLLGMRRAALQAADGGAAREAALRSRAVVEPVGTEGLTT